MNQTITKEIELSDIPQTIQRAKSHSYVDQMDYDAYFDKNSAKASKSSTFCKLIKIAIDIGILALPSGFKTINMLGGILLLLISGLLQFFSWQLLVDSVSEKGRFILQLVKKDQKEDESEEDADDDQGKYNPSNHDFSRVSSFRTSRVDVDQQNEMELEKNNKIEIVVYRKINLITTLKEGYPDRLYIAHFIEFSTLALLQGKAVSYFVFIDSLLVELFPMLGDYKYFVAFGMSLIILPFTFAKNLESLRKSILGGSYMTMIMLYFVVSICVFQMKLNSDDPYNLSQKILNEDVDLVIKSTINPAAIAPFFGVSLFAYDINGVITDIREEMAEPQKFNQLLAFSMAFEFVLFLSVGVLGYSAYGQYTKPLITNNIYFTIQNIGNGIRTIYFLFQCLYGISLVVTIIIQSVVGLKILRSSLEMMKVPTDKFYVKLGYHYLYISFFIFLGIYLKNFTYVISFLGCLTSVILGFIMPFTLFYQIFKGKVGITKLGLSTLVLITGVSGGLIGILILFIKF